MSAPTMSPARRPFRAYRTAFLRIAAFLVVGAVAAFAGGFGIFATYVGNLATPEQVTGADAIVVLTGGQARIDAAFQLLRAGKGKRLLITGVNPATLPRDLRPQTAKDRQLFNCCVDFDYEARDTIGNANESAKWVQLNGYDSIIVVTNNYHMPRSLLELGRHTGASVEPYPVVNTRLDDGRWLSEPQALRVLMTEYIKYVVSLLRGLMPEGMQQEAIKFVQGAQSQS